MEGRLSIILIAKDGYIYTNGRDFGRKIHLASGVSGDEWYTIPIEEYEKILKENENKNENIPDY